MAVPYIPTYHDLNVTFAAASSNSSHAAQATVHYAEAGDPHLPPLLFLHGFPSSSFEYRDVLPLFADSYHVLAPDMPGFGLTKVPKDFTYTFANLTAVIAAWLGAMNMTSFGMYIHDYGAPVGLRLAVGNPASVESVNVATIRAPEVKAVITQNGNAYVEGFGQEFWAPIFNLWNTSNSASARAAVAKGVFNLDAIKEQYTVGTPAKDLDLIDPTTWTLDYLQNIQGAANTQHQLDLFYDYRTNVQLYPAFQKWFASSKVPILAVWGKGDPAFIPPGAEAFGRQLGSQATVRLLDAGHFAVETKRWEIARIAKTWLNGVGY